MGSNHLKTWALVYVHDFYYIYILSYIRICLIEVIHIRDNWNDFEWLWKSYEWQLSQISTSQRFLQALNWIFSSQEISPQWRETKSTWPVGSTFKVLHDYRAKWLGQGSWKVPGGWERMGMVGISLRLWAFHMACWGELKHGNTHSKCFCSRNPSWSDQLFHCHACLPACIFFRIGTRMFLWTSSRGFRHIVDTSLLVFKVNWKLKLVKLNPCRRIKPCPKMALYFFEF